MVPWLRLCTSNAGGAGLIPGQGTEIPHALWHGQKTPKNRDFPGGAVVKNPPANAGDTGSSPGPGRSHMPRSS